MTTTRQLMKGALRLINVIGANEEPTADDADITLDALNGLVDSLGTDLLNIHTFTPYRFPLVPGQQDYTLGPALDKNGTPLNPDWVVTRPNRIEQAKLLLYPLIEYPVDPSCNLPSSIQDEHTIDLWHFDEPTGSTEIVPTVDFFDSYAPRSIGPAWALEPACCGNGLRAPGEFYSEGITLSEGAYQGESPYEVDEMTIEFYLTNPGTTNPTQTDYAEVFRLDTVSYAGGEGQGTIRGFKVGQDLLICRDSDIYYPWVVIPIATCTRIAIELQFLTVNTNTIRIWADGESIWHYDLSNFWGVDSGSYLKGTFTYFSMPNASKHDLTIDEFQRSRVMRYTTENPT